MKKRRFLAVIVFLSLFFGLCQGAVAKNVCFVHTPSSGLSEDEQQYDERYYYLIAKKVFVDDKGTTTFRYVGHLANWIGETAPVIGTGILYKNADRQTISLVGVIRKDRRPWLYPNPMSRILRTLEVPVNGSFGIVAVADTELNCSAEEHRETEVLELKPLPCEDLP